MAVNHRTTDQRPSKVLVYAAAAFVLGMGALGVYIVLHLPGWLGY